MAALSFFIGRKKKGVILIIYLFATEILSLLGYSFLGILQYLGI